MSFQFTYRTTAKELWQLSMYYTYGSLAGVCNIVFTAAVLALTASRWRVSGTGFRILLILGLCLFPVIQPLAVYLRAKKQAAAAARDMTISFDELGIHCQIGANGSNLKWSEIKKISKKPTMIIVFSDTTHGFVLTDRVLGAEKEAFYKYISSKIVKQ